MTQDFTGVMNSTPPSFLCAIADTYFIKPINSKILFSHWSIIQKMYKDKGKCSQFNHLLTSFGLLHSRLSQGKFLLSLEKFSISYSLLMIDKSNHLLPCPSLKYNLIINFHVDRYSFSLSNLEIFSYCLVDPLYIRNLSIQIYYFAVYNVLVLSPFNFFFFTL